MPVKYANGERPNFGRGPKGNLRNFNAMFDDKLLKTWRIILELAKQGDVDEEAIEAVEYELITREHLEGRWEEWEGA